MATDNMVIIIVNIIERHGMERTFMIRTGKVIERLEPCRRVRPVSNANPPLYGSANMFHRDVPRPMHRVADWTLIGLNEFVEIASGAVLSS